MRILIVYATTEGHTRNISRFIAIRLVAAGHEVTLCDAADARPPDPAGFGAAILAGSLHVGHYQAALVHYAKRWHAALDRTPSAFVSVSLAAASDNLAEVAGLTPCLERFEVQTGWTPRWVHQAAGAILYSKYDFFRRLAMRAIAKRHGAGTSGDHDYTDYQALGRFVDDIAVTAAAPVLEPA